MRFCDSALIVRRKFVALGLAGACLLACIAACKPNPKQKSDAAPPPNSSAPVKKEALLADWPTPQAVLVFTGDIHGYMEPCGCTEGQSGGFALRGDLLRQLRDVKKWPTTAFDVGGTLNDSRLSYPQTRIKFSMILQGLNQLGYKGIALGKEELLLGAQELFTEYTNVSAESGFDVPFLASNVTIFGTKDLGTPLTSRVVEIGGLKIGIAAISGNTTKKDIEAAGVIRDENELKVEDPRTVLPDVIEKLKAEKPDLMVLLSASAIEESQELAKEFPEFKIVVTAGSAEDPRIDPVYVGDTMLVQVGRKGKNAAIVGVYPEGKLKFTILPLAVSQFSDLPAMIDLMRTYQERLKNNWPTLSAQSIPDPQHGSFAGAESCKKCHTFAYKVWKESKHSHAYESLLKGRPGKEENWVSRIYDPECLACHVTGWDPQRALRYQSGFIDMDKTPLLAGQQCENCHGAAANHVAAETAWAPGMPVSPEMTEQRQAVRMTLSQAKANLCLTCHDGDNSPHFEFDKYWPKINHSGRKD